MKGVAKHDPPLSTVLRVGVEREFGTPNVEHLDP